MTYPVANVKVYGLDESVRTIVSLSGEPSAAGSPPFLTPNSSQEVLTMMTFDQYQQLARRTQNQSIDQTSMFIHSICGLMGELGEVASIYQKKIQGHPVDNQKVCEELGDLLWFVAEFSDWCGLNLSDVAANNVAKLLKRYPDGFEEVRSLNRE